MKQEENVINNRIQVSPLAYGKIEEEIRMLEKEIPDKVSATNRDNPESQDAVISGRKLRRLKEILPLLEIVTRDEKKDEIQIGDTVVFKAIFEGKKVKHTKIVDGYSYGPNVCVLMKEFLGKKRGNTIPQFGNMSNIEIIDFYPPK